MTLHTPYQRSILLLVLLASLLVTCRKQVSEPEYESPFDETSAAYVPTLGLNTAPITGITALAAVTGGVFENNYGKPATAKGVCWSLVENPTLTKSCTNEVPGTSSFTSSLTNLLPDTLYYVRAYATNEAGTIYCGQLEFTTMGDTPTVTPGLVSSITVNSASASASVTNSGSSSVTSRGVCYSTLKNPTTSSSCVNSGSGTGSFSVTLSGLSSNTTYYVRAYAISNVGTSYSSQVEFRTLAILTTLTTPTFYNVLNTSFRVASTVNHSGSSSVTSRGVCHSLSFNFFNEICVSDSYSGTGTSYVNVYGLV